jgi:hypothetical protein
MKTIFYCVTFWAFIVIKAFGAALAAWSWWWLLLPIVPDLWLVLSKAGLLS